MYMLQKNTSILCNNHQSIMRKEKPTPTPQSEAFNIIRIIILHYKGNAMRVH